MPRVLVIDDQSDVRTMISIVLRINQFEIVEAATAEAGLTAFEAADFDLAIVDIFLQGSNGSDVIATMRERVPDLPVVAISGMTALDFLSKSPELADVVCLQKPFRPTDLIRAIDAAREAMRPSAGAVAGAARGSPPFSRHGRADCPTRRLPASSATVSRGGTGSGAVWRASGTRSRQTRPSGRQSNSAFPPSCDSMLAMTLRVPNPLDTGFSTTGPPVSIQTSSRRPELELPLHR